ncbi:Ribosomal protein S18 acetylase RimI [Cognatishimia maritima]|uniref:Ribosomal protein S18 acetylase RimI n=2 Tax=Cognatishimia maritima TaxID=870908 RepID=A0A1M5RXV1_9RHOB|nr:GNAT family N-acetyltransferase [Cognatishimia maritima]SHH30848.1 Ribosomal protein S18 acetylase RimI [Cognatishimia maritima]
MPEFNIRPLQKDDFEAWNRLWQGYLTFYEASLSDEVTHTTFERLCDPKTTDQNALVAEQDGALIGLVHFIFHAHNWQTARVTYLQDLYALPEARGIGLGRALIESVYAAADANGTPSVYWMTQDFNAEARKLYDRVGTLTPFIKYTRA